jgi:RimJ/RimL family protein N-acetyltransferase
MTTIKTKRLRIKELSEEDAHFIVQLLNQASFIKYIADKGVRNTKDAKDYIKTGPQKSFKKYGFGLMLVQRLEDNEKLGICGLLKRDYLDHPDIGFAFLDKFSKRGYGFESASAILANAKIDKKLETCLAITALDNNASEKLLLKLGFNYRCIIQTPPENVDAKLFEWRN